MGPVAHYRRRSKADGVLSMFQRYRGNKSVNKPTERTATRHALVRHAELPFDLELTRRVIGQSMATKWGMRDPAEAVPINVHYELPNDDDVMEGAVMPLARAALPELPAYDLWNDLRPTPFGYGAISPLDAQLRLTGADRALARGFDDLRTQLLRTIQGEGWSRIAVVAPTEGCGASYTAVNLALSVARIPDARVVLMDMDQRKPAIAEMLGVPAPGDIQRLLSGMAPPEAHLVRPSDTLALGLGINGAHNTSEILHARRTGSVLNSMIGALRPDIVLYDMPAMLEHDDLEAFLPQVDGVLLVADATRTLARQIAECERRLEGKTHLLGIVLNRTRPTAQPCQRAA